VPGAEPARRAATVACHHPQLGQTPKQEAGSMAGTAAASRPPRRVRGQGRPTAQRHRPAPQRSAAALPSRLPTALARPKPAAPPQRTKSGDAGQENATICIDRWPASTANTSPRLASARPLPKVAVAAGGGCGSRARIPSSKRAASLQRRWPAIQSALAHQYAERHAGNEGQPVSSPWTERGHAAPARPLWRISAAAGMKVAADRASSSRAANSPA
jgi:hypothetical protein